MIDVVEVFGVDLVDVVFDYWYYVYNCLFVNENLCLYMKVCY